MPDEKGNAYPQRIWDAGINKSGFSNDKRGPAYFKTGNNIIFMKPKQVINVKRGKKSISILCESQGYLNKIVNTHETQMHQFAKAEDCKGIFNISIAFWSDSIMRVRFGKEEPSDLEPEFPPIEGRMLVGTPEKDIRLTIEENEEKLIAITDKIILKVDKKQFCMEMYDLNRKLIWKQCRNDLSTSDIFDISASEEKGRASCFESFQLHNQEEIFGLGERFDHVTRRGKSVDFWNKDAIGTSNTRTYINVPFLFSTHGYGLFLNSSCRTEWEIGTLEGSTLGFSIEDRQMDYFIIYGPTPAEILYKYSTLTGFSPVPPVWSFGLWMSRNSYLSWDIVNEVANKLREKDIPADVLHLDTAWFREDWNCDLKFSEERFANPEENMKNLKDKGFRVCLWQYNFVPPRENNENYREGLAKGFFAAGHDGKPFTFPEGTVGSWIDDAIIDFSNPEACEWYTEKIKDLIRKGAATIKTDFGEGIPEDAVYKNINGKVFHNLYSLVYNSVVAKAITEVSGEHIVWARSGTAGSQRYPIHWNGDSQCSFAGLSGTVKGGLSLGMSGIPFYSSDIGGFIGRPDPELYIRWAQVGLFLSHSRCHGCGDDNSREPWSFGGEAERIFRKYAKMRYRLMPYILNEAIKSCKTAKPMVRALIIEYPEDRNVWYIDDQYMFGDCMLLAPVLEPLEISSTRKLYLPAGKWVDYWTKDVIHSLGQWIERAVNLETMPIYVKAGSILCYGEEKSHTGNEIGRITKIESYWCKDKIWESSDGSNIFKVIVDNNGHLCLKGIEYEPEIVTYGNW